MTKPKPSWEVKPSLVSQVVHAVRKRGTATLDDIQPEFPGVTRKKLNAALSNGRDARLLRVAVRGNFKAQRASIWAPGERAPLAPPPMRVHRPLPSVWALGTPIEWVGEWPPKGEGRQFVNLTDDETEDESALMG